ncbi:hypothetical protein H4582DRAFT_1057614 [Lactarius indigo]|nr:hypothetical protein H4582DRAFT_1057614 [Lactarius indigo]
MLRNWGTERTPIMIFLSNEKSAVSDEETSLVSRCFAWSRLFGPILRKMSQIALEIQESTPQNPRLPVSASVPPSSFRHRPRYDVPYGGILGCRRLGEEATGFTGLLKPFCQLFERCGLRLVTASYIKCSEMWSLHKLV